MMDVWVVISVEWDAGTVNGVFDTREAADALVRSINRYGNTAHAECHTLNVADSRQYEKDIDFDYDMIRKGVE